ncbi:hypothetical protein EVAR_60391_1 [Eumeta japonica]|uniref:Uncharacterized protein n=1 Tax=Eumeta variegata TaxID=151549 RepID=A0A4C1YSQ6_EUMVA|nr:hypothetical protein EVAR_60391_1 [Eumeta japonica]
MTPHFSSLTPFVHLLIEAISSYDMRRLCTCVRNLQWTRTRRATLMWVERRTGRAACGGAFCTARFQRGPFTRAAAGPRRSRRRCGRRPDAIQRPLAPDKGALLPGESRDEAPTRFLSHTRTSLSIAFQCPGEIVDLLKQKPPCDSGLDSDGPHSPNPDTFFAKLNKKNPEMSVKVRLGRRRRILHSR